MRDELTMSQQSSIQYFYEIEGYAINEQETSSWLQFYLKVKGEKLSVLRIIFYSDEKLLEMNQQYLGHDYYTDIITFPLSRHPIEAELYISVDRVEDNALQFGVSGDQEMRRVIIHGLLHVLGHEDSNVELKQEMSLKEDEALHMFNSREWEK